MKEKIHGFSPKAEKSLPELHGILHEWEHDQTGAKLVWIERKEENKTFGIAFTTLPEDDTGVYHILEHSVLCGSEHYPVKEPFVELMKHSMNTFLNAMTFPDKTFYPISSRNEKDFLNLMRVYLDAVFYPAIYAREEIFRQEGWHYEFDQDGTVSYQGVVFNEMKGALANADEQMEQAMNQGLFPDTPYRYLSGGDPMSIPNLTYEQFLDAHRKFYSPSNSYIFLDGDLDIGQILVILNDEYLGRFERGERIPAPPAQRAQDGGEREIAYEIASDEPVQNRTRLAWGSVIGGYDDRERIVAVQILSQVLCGSNQAPLSKAVLSRGLAENVIMQVNDGVCQPWVRLEVRNLDAMNLEKTEQIVIRELERLAAEGLDASQLEAAMARLEFQMRERDYGSYPQGLIYGLQVLESWLYGGAPEANLEVGDLFDHLRIRQKDGYFEKLIREVLLENRHRCKVILKPSHMEGERRRTQEQKRLEKETAAWSNAERQTKLEMQEALRSWQNSEDTWEQLATLPHLERSDLPAQPEQLPVEELHLAGIPVIHHRLESGGIVYLTLFFDVEGCSEEELSYLSFLGEILGKTATNKHNVEELTNQIRLLCGNLKFYVSSYTQEEDVKACRVKFCCALSTLERNVSAALKLVAEILTETTIGNENSVLELLRQNKNQLHQKIIMSGHSVALGRLAAQVFAAAVVKEHTGGIACYRWLKEQEHTWNWPKMQTALHDLLSRTVSRERLTLSVTCTSETVVEAAAGDLAAMLPVRMEKPLPNSIRPWGVRKEGIVIPADISFAARGGKMHKYSGELLLAGRIISLAHLWNVIRVQGGAYGTGMAIQGNGLAACYSYRDPNASRSLEQYLDCADFLRQFCLGKPDLTGFIIGAVSDASPLMTPRMKGETADDFYWSGVTWEQRCGWWRQILSATPERLLALADELEAAIAGGGICVIGGRNVLDGCVGLEQVSNL